MEPSKGADVPRPRDLSPGSVRDEDVLAGWDEVVPRRGRQRAKYLPEGRLGGQLAGLPALVIVVGGGLAGGFVGALLSRQRWSFGAAVGTLAGAGTAVAGVHLRDHGHQDA